MASHSPREDLFQKHYDEIVSLLEAFVNSVVVSGDYLSAESSLIGYLIDMYSSVFLDEIDYILDALGVDLAPEELIEIRNGVNTSAFARSNYGRLKEILDAHASDLKAKLIDTIDTISFDDIVKEFRRLLWKVPSYLSLLQRTPFSRHGTVLVMLILVLHVWQ